jgi:hypothetical protein
MTERKWHKDEEQKNREEKAKHSDNYNERLDGYGVGESEDGGEEEKDQYGEVDQYSFRESPIGNTDDKKEQRPVPKTD